MWMIGAALAVQVNASLPADGAVGVPTDVRPLLSGDFEDPHTVGLAGPSGPISVSVTADGPLLEIDAGLLDALTDYTITLTPEVGAVVTLGFTTSDAPTIPGTAAPTMVASFSPGDCITGGGLGTATGDFAFPILQPFELALAGFVFPDDTDDISWVDDGGSGTVTALLNAAVPYADLEVCAVAWVRYPNGTESAVAESCVVPPPLDCTAEPPEPEKGCGCAGSDTSRVWAGLVALAARRRSAE